MRSAVAGWVASSPPRGPGDRSTACRRLEHAHHSAGIVTGGDEIAQPEVVGLALVVAAEAGHHPAGGQVRGGGGQPFRILSEGDGRHHLQAQVRGELLGRVPGHHVAQLVGQDPGQLGLVVGQEHQAGEDVGRAAGQGEGVDLVRVVEDGDPVVDAGAVEPGLLDERLRQEPHVALDPGVAEDAVLGLDLGGQPAAEVDLGLHRHQSVSEDLAEGGTAAQTRGGQDRGCEDRGARERRGPQPKSGALHDLARKRKRAARRGRALGWGLLHALAPLHFVAG